MKESATRRWVGRIVLAIVGPLFWLELLLQIAALLTPKSPADAAPRDAAQTPCCALCIGDSYTFGLGASNESGSYPSQLEARLCAAPIDGRWRVANAGVPGRDSRDLLLDLPRQMRREQPRFVVILVGVNELWSRPEPANLIEAALAAGCASPPWHFEWRTRKLVKLLLHRPKTAEVFAGMGVRTAVRTPSAKPAERAPPPKCVDVQYSYQLVGSWRFGADTIRFARDGSGTRGDQKFRWRVARAGLLLLDFADGAPAFEVKAQRHPRRLLLTPAASGTTVAFEQVAGADPAGQERKPWEWYPEVNRLSAAGDLNGALACAEHWIKAEPDDSSAWWNHLDVATRLRRNDVAATDLAQIERLVRSTGSCDAVENLVSGCNSINQPERAWQLARDEIARFPASAQLRFHLAMAADHAGDFATAVKEMTLSLEEGDRSPGFYLGLRYRERARWNARLRRNVDAVCDLIEAMRAFPDDKHDVQLLLRCDFDEGSFDAAFERSEATDEERAAVRQRFAESVAARSSKPPETLIDHLTQIVRWLRDQGAEPILCTYPFRSYSIETAQRRVAGSEHVRLVDLAARFEALLTSHARSELFVPDGHCNDAGYRIVAEEVDAALREVGR